MRWVWSYAVWSGWLLAFLALELAGLYRVGPWVTLSETSWHAQATYRWLIIPLFGFILGLSLHIGLRLSGTHVALWRAALFGMIVAAALQLLVSPSLP